MRLFITGSSGSGKTTLARKIREKTGVEITDLETLSWEQDSQRFGVKRAPAQREELLKKILSNENWILEGSDISWAERGFRMADSVILVDPPPARLKLRLIQGFIKRSLGIEKARGFESLEDLRQTIKWNKERSASIRLLLNRFEVEGIPVVRLRTLAEEKSFLASLT